MQRIREPSSLPLAGRIAIVTGAGRGIGAATATMLAHHGADVVVTDIDEARARQTADRIRTDGCLAEPRRLDVGSRDEVEAVLDAVVRSHGGVDILINNAGIVRATPAADIALEEWELVLRINLAGAFLCSKAVYPAMTARGGGRIINVASIAGRSTSTVGDASYTAAKSGLLGLSRHLAKEWAAQRITVNAVCPGMVDTAMVRELMNSPSLRQIVSAIPLGRMAEPVEIAALIAYLVSDDAAFITGATIDINGGELIVA